MIEGGQNSTTSSSRSRHQQQQKDRYKNRTHGVNQHAVANAIPQPQMNDQPGGDDETDVLVWVMIMLALDIS